MSHEHFEEVIELEVDDLRRLLERGDAQESLWAAWALALKLGKGVVSDLEGALNDSPTPGIRRHLVVILSGLGEQETVRAFAALDPDARVRATACQYLMNTWRDDDTETADFLLTRLLLDEAVAVKETILREARAGLPPATLEQTVSLAAHDAEEVRRASIALIRSRFAPDVAFSGALAERLYLESAPELLGELLDYCLAGGSLAPVFEAVRHGCRSVRTLILDRLVQKGRSLTWSEACELVALNEPMVDLKLLDLMGDEALCDGFDWLVQHLARLLACESYDPFFHAGLNRLFDVAALLDSRSHSPNSYPDLRKLLVFVDAQRQWAEKWNPELEDEGFDEEDRRSMLEFYDELSQRISTLIRSQ